MFGSLSQSERNINRIFSELICDHPLTMQPRTRRDSSVCVFLSTYGFQGPDQQPQYKHIHPSFSSDNRPSEFAVASCGTRAELFLAGVGY
jgi:hypothetical protein